MPTRKRHRKFTDAVGSDQPNLPNNKVITVDDILQDTPKLVLDPVRIVESVNAKDELVIFGAVLKPPLEPQPKSGWEVVVHVRCSKHEFEWTVMFLCHILGPADLCHHRIVWELAITHQVADIALGCIIQMCHEMQHEWEIGRGTEADLGIVELPTQLDKILPLLLHKGSPCPRWNAPLRRLEALHMLQKAREETRLGGVSSGMFFVPLEMGVGHEMADALLPRQHGVVAVVRRWNHGFVGVGITVNSMLGPSVNIIC